jgi:hypothetical protein
MRFLLGFGFLSLPEGYIYAGNIGIDLSGGLV